MGLLILIVFIGVMVYFVSKKKKSDFLTFWKEKEPSMSVDEKYNHDKVEREKETNRILDKIFTRGYDSLTGKEKEYLDKQKNE